MNYKEKFHSLTTEERAEFEAFAWPFFLEGTIHSGITAAFQQKLDGILSRREPPKPVFDWWEPGIREEYYCITETGLVYQDRWDNAHGDTLRRTNGCIFSTQEAAEREARRTTARRFYEHCCRVANGGTLRPKAGAMWCLSRCSGGEDNWRANDSVANCGVCGVEDYDTARAIRAAMIEKNLLNDYFGE